MTDNYKELEKQIVEKNTVLNSLRGNRNEDREKASHIKNELDKLLFAYYKSLKCRYTGALFLRPLL
ncbi:MAG: hypothetical protein N3I35_14250 [Clostridia bacterium]|nr:hypothetical protein [Clostridia bacterium]